MAKILTTKGSVAALEDIIRTSKERIFLISYSFIISESFITRLKQAVERGRFVTLVYGKSISQNSYASLVEMPNIKLLKLENLHAKIFANEVQCLVGSMNFSEASELNNTELGVLLTRADDQSAYEDVMEHVKDVVDQAILERPMMPKSILDENRKNGFRSNEKPKSKEQKQGFCIRTRQRIPLNYQKPYHPSAYEDWLIDGGDERQPENYDHFSGEASKGKTSKERPILSKNWSKYQKAVLPW